MSESLWQSEMAVEAQPDGEDAKPGVNLTDGDAVQEPRALTVTVNDFAGLEERVLRAVSVVKQERQARQAAEERAERAEAALGEQVPRLEQMQAELNALRSERDQVRTRVERLLGQLDALEL
jgi:chromosome segregation ATPase